MRPRGRASSGGKSPRARNKRSSAPRRPAAAPAEGKYRLKLYVAGQSPKSLRALENLRRFCEKYLPGKYEIEVIDLLERPQLAAGDQILALPTLVKNLPLPIRRIIGDLSDTSRVLVGLDLEEF